jgi:transcriptional regulator GlxA family with amidase domain
MTALVQWLRQVHAATTWTTSVCTGSLYLAAAGILDGLDATTHWPRKEDLERLGAHYTEERVVERGKVITPAGVSSGINMALAKLAPLAAASTSTYNDDRGRRLARVTDRRVRRRGHQQRRGMDLHRLRRQPDPPPHALYQSFQRIVADAEVPLLRFHDLGIRTAACCSRKAYP